MARAVGTRLAGVDLRLEGSDDAAAAQAQFERVREALHTHGVVVLPGQSDELTREQLHAFAMRWGPIALHIGQGPNEYPGLPGMLTINDGFSDEDPAPEPGATEFGPTWHCDFAACVRPGYATVLNCRSTPTGERPEQRCDTLFADLVSAFDAMPEPEQLELSRLKVRMSYRSRQLYDEVFSRSLEEKQRQQQGGAAKAGFKNLTIGGRTEEEAQALLDSLRPDVEHPLVRNVLGRPVIYLGQADAGFIVDTQQAEESDSPLETIIEGHLRLAELQAFCTQPRFVHNHVWAKGDVVVWDNRQVIHMADYSFARHSPTEKRVMWHVGTKDPLRPRAWDVAAVGDCLTPEEPPTDQWLPEADGARL